MSVTLSASESLDARMVLATAAALLRHHGDTTVAADECDTLAALLVEREHSARAEAQQVTV